MKDQRTPDTRTPEQRKTDHDKARDAFNAMILTRPNRVTATAVTTRQQLNHALRKAAGREVSIDDEIRAMRLERLKR